MLYGTETWCLRENEMAISRRTERAMCGSKQMEKKKTEDLIEMLGLKGREVQMAKVNGVEIVWACVDGHVLRALEFEVKGKRKQGQPKNT